MRGSVKLVGPFLFAAFVAACGEIPTPPLATAPDGDALKAGQWVVVPTGAATGRSRTMANLSASAVTVGQFANGSFEANYDGWTLFEGGLTTAPFCGTWGIASNGETINFGQAIFDFFDQINVNQGSPGLPHTYTATDGNKVSLQLQNCAQTHRMYQDIALPVGVTTISWDMEYRNHSGSFVPTQQEMQINVRDVNTDAVLLTLFTTTPASPQTIPMTHFTAVVSAFAGQTVRISVDHTVNNFFFDAAWDNFEVDLVVATNKDQCKNDGWMEVVRADGSSFKNQGDCIQYVNTGK